MADTGFLFPTTFNAGDTGNSFVDRTKLGADDNDRTACTGTTGTVNETKLADFGISIAAGSTIDGIEVRAAGLDTCADGSYYASAFLSYDGTSETSEKFFFTSTHWGATETEYTVGGPTDTWGRTWSVSELSDANFRVIFNVQTDSFPGEILTDYVKVKVYYTEAGGTAVPVFRRHYQMMQTR